MKVYLDHNALIFWAEKADENYKKSVLLDIEEGKIKIVLSLFSIVEIARDPNHDRAMDLALFVDILKPVWINTAFNIQRQEISNYLNNKGSSDSKINVFFDNIEDAFHGGLEIKIPYDSHNVSKIIRCFKNVSLLDSINESMLDFKFAIEYSSNAFRDKGKPPGFESELAFRWLKNRVNGEFPNNTLYLNELIARYLTGDFKNLRRASPAVDIEFIIADFRLRNFKRKPEVQDAIDNQHTIAALSYCDRFITRDGYLKSACHHILKKRRNNICSIADYISTKWD